jgi:hypothetical protein
VRGRSRSKAALLCSPQLVVSCDNPRPLIDVLQSCLQGVIVEMRFSMSDRSLPLMLMIVTLNMLCFGAALAQDVPGIEICTVEKTMERRTSCLQSNINFLQTTLSKHVIGSKQKIDAANRQMQVLESTVAELRKAVAELQAASQKQPLSPTKEDEKHPAKQEGK